MTPEEAGEQFFRAQKDVERLLEQDATPWSLVYALWRRFKRMPLDAEPEAPDVAS